MTQNQDDNKDKLSEEEKQELARKEEEERLRKEEEEKIKYKAGTSHNNEATAWAYSTKDVNQWILKPSTYTGEDKLVFLTFDDGFRAYPVSQFWQIGDRATREDILLDIKYPLGATCEKSLKNIVRDGKAISADEILNAPIVLFKKRKLPTL